MEDWLGRVEQPRHRGAARREPGARDRAAEGQGVPERTLRPSAVPGPSRMARCMVRARYTLFPTAGTTILN
jgi:hypothetical protein